MRAKLISVGLCLLLSYATTLRGAHLVMGVEDLPYLPYYALQDGEYIGYSRELFDAFARDRGHTLEYRPLPVERLFLSLLNGDIDLKYPDSPDWRRELKDGREFHYSRAVAPYRDGIMVRPERLGASLAALHIIGTIRGFTPGPLLEPIRQGRITLTENNSIPGLLRQAIAGRVGGAYINVAVAHFQLQGVLGQERALVLDTQLPHTHSSYVVSTTRRPQLVHELDTWLEQHSTLVIGLRHKWGIEEE